MCSKDIGVGGRKCQIGHDYTFGTFSFECWFVGLGVLVFLARM